MSRVLTSLFFAALTGIAIGVLGVFFGWPWYVDAAACAVSTLAWSSPYLSRSAFMRKWEAHANVCPQCSQIIAKNLPPHLLCPEGFVLGKLATH